METTHPVSSGDTIETTLGQFTKNPTRVRACVVECLPPHVHDADVDEYLTSVEVRTVLDENQSHIPVGAVYTVVLSEDTQLISQQ